VSNSTDKLINKSVTATVTACQQKIQSKLHSIDDCPITKHSFNHDDIIEEDMHTEDLKSSGSDTV
jgi:hypothetical protein